MNDPSDDYRYELLNLLSLERLDDNLFRGISQDIGTGRIYGGQALGQAASAAQQTVDENRSIHSLHGYFLREGDHTVPVIYDVDRTRDGKSYSSRRVRAIQHGRPIFTLEASFHVREEGLEFNQAIDNLTAPEDIENYYSLSEALKIDSNPMSARLSVVARKFSTKILIGDSGNGDVSRRAWIKMNARIDRPERYWHSVSLAYMSDFGLLTTVIQAHGYEFPSADLQLASLDHAMWFHRDFRVDDWLLYETKGTTTSGGRGHATGSFYTRDGLLVASCAQEGVIRELAED